jgi:hypothetical protein
VCKPLPAWFTELVAEKLARIALGYILNMAHSGCQGNVAGSICCNQRQLMLHNCITLDFSTGTHCIL